MLMVCSSDGSVLFYEPCPKDIPTWPVRLSMSSQLYAACKEKNFGDVPPGEYAECACMYTCICLYAYMYKHALLM
jgi:hypothetical protein